VQENARQDPGRCQLQRVARDHQQHDRRQRRTEPAGEGALSRLPVHVGRGIAHHDPAHEGDQHQHHRADRIEPGRDAKTAKADQRACRRAAEDQQDARKQRDAHCHDGRDLHEAERIGGAELRAAEGQNGRCDQGDRREEGKDGDRHGGMSPVRKWLLGELAGTRITIKFIVCGISFCFSDRFAALASVPLMRVSARRAARDAGATVDGHGTDSDGQGRQVFDEW
jgi:hypothetical protein